MDDTAKRNWAIISFIPFLAWSVWCAYIMIITRPLIISQSYQDHEKIVTTVSQHFTMVTALVGIASLVMAVMLFINVIHLARLKNLNAGSKAGWIVFMIAFGAVAFPIFWYLQIRTEPKREEFYPSIA